MDGFRVLRPFTARSIDAAAGTRQALTVKPPTIVNLSATIDAASGTRADGLVIYYTGRPAGALGTFRELVAAVLEPINESWTVYPLPVDAVTPPAYMLTWADPWTVPATHCRHTVRLDVVCIAGRIDPDPGIETLEHMVGDALTAFGDAGIPYTESGAPRPMPIGGVTYLAARIQVTQTV